MEITKAVTRQRSNSLIVTKKNDLGARLVLPDQPTFQRVKTALNRKKVFGENLNITSNIMKTENSKMPAVSFPPKFLKSRKPSPMLRNQNFVSKPLSASRTRSKSSLLDRKSKDKSKESLPQIRHYQSKNREEKILDKISIPMKNTKKNEFTMKIIDKCIPKTKEELYKNKGKHSSLQRNIVDMQELMAASSIPSQIKLKEIDAFIDLLKSKKISPEEFVYLKKPKNYIKGDAYTLKITTFNKIQFGNLQEYYTISGKGLTRFINNKPIEFTSLVEWLRERRHFETVKNLKFFAEFSRWKIIKRWCKFNSKRIKRKMQIQLENRMFQVHPVYQKLILKHKNTCHKIEQLRFIEYSSQEAISLEGFSVLQENRRRYVSEYIRQYSGKMHEQCISSIQAILEKEKEDIMRDYVDEDKKGENEKAEKEEISEKRTILEIMEFPKKLSYGDKSRIRVQCQKFSKLLYLLDFMTSESINSVYKSSVSEFLSKLDFMSNYFNPESGNRESMISELEVESGSDDSDLVFERAKKEPLFLAEIKFQSEFLKHPSNFSFWIQETDKDEVMNNLQDFDLKFWVESSGNTKKSAFDYESIKKRVGIHLSHECLKIKPSKHELSLYINECINEGSKCLKGIERFIRNSNYLPYLFMLESWDSSKSSELSQFENKLFDPFKWFTSFESNFYNNSMNSASQVISDCYSRIERLLEKYEDRLQQFYLSLVNDYNSLEKADFDNFVEVFQVVIKYDNWLLKSSQGNFLGNVNEGIIRVDFSHIAGIIQDHYATNHKKLEHILMNLLNIQIHSVKDNIADGMKSVSGVVLKIEDFISQRKNLEVLQNKLPDLKAKKKKLDKLSILFDAEGLMVPLDERQVLTEIRKLETGLSSAINSAETSFTKNIDRFKKVADERIEKLISDTTEVFSAIMDPSYLKISEDPESILQELLKMQNLMNSYEDDSKKLIEYQQLMNFEKLSTFENISVGKHQLEYRIQLWESHLNWQQLESECMDLRLEEINESELTEKIKNFIKNVAVMEKNIPDNEVLQTLKVTMSQMKEILPVASYLKGEFMKPRHYALIKELTSNDIDFSSENLTIREIVESGLSLFSSEILEICEVAKQEHELENQLNTLEREWERKELSVKSYKDNAESYILVGIEGLLENIEDSIIQISNIQSSRFVMSLKKLADNLEETLTLISAIIKKWADCQKKWLYLENIFLNRDIKGHLATESILFEACDKILKQTAKRAALQPKISKFIYTTGLFENLKKAAENLASIEKNLESYLDIKRSIFPRFYFISNEELIDLLSNSNNMELVQASIRNLFDNVQAIEFDQDGLTIKAIKSREGEKLQLKKSGFMAKGALENWLETLSNNISLAVRNSISSSFKDFVHSANKSRLEWIYSYCGQAASVCSQIFWCASTEEAIRSSERNPNIIAEWYDLIVKQLIQISEVLSGEMPASRKNTLLCILTQDVHNRDIVEEIYKRGVASTGDFEWKKQLRYYYDEDSENCSIYQIESRISYGYEYIGCTSRLVVTPLTERCWLTATTALSFHLGTAPIGPAGTGKTESVKDLAKGLGRFCYVFNCSESVAISLLNQVLAGLCCLGAWACFDEFNRIEVEVLSVITQQFLQIRFALQCKMSEFAFEGKKVSIRDHIGIFVTMNPGYKGRTELPDSLKVLFRTVAMMIPDYAYIAEVMLFSEGFVKAHEIAQRVMRVYQLACEKLSEQIHYDFGLRAIKTLLSYCGKLKRERNSENEHFLILQALEACEYPKMLKEDLVTFKNLVLDIFSDIQYPQTPRNLVLEEEIQASTEIHGLEMSVKFLEKVKQLHSTLSIRFGVIIMGDAGSGKSTIRRILRKSLDTHKIMNNEKSFDIEEISINPKSLTLKDFYGEFDFYTKDWRDGVTSSVIRKANSRNGESWIVFDGPIDTLWIENMNTVLDDSKLLCLPNSERIKISNSVKMIFEVENLSVASPATVSRCGIVFVSSDVLSHYQIFSAHSVVWDLNKACFKVLAEFYNHCFEKILPELMKDCKMIVNYSVTLIAIQLCRFLDVFIKGDKLKDQHISDEEKARRLIHIFAFSFIWGVLTLFDQKDVQKVEFIVREIFKSIALPRNESLFDIYLDPETQGSFSTWENKDGTNCVISYNEIVIPSIDLKKYNYIIDCLSSIGVFPFFMDNNLYGRNIANTICNFTLNLSGYSGISTLASFLETKLSNKGRGFLSGQITSKKGKSNSIVLIDDVSLPEPEESGAQPVLEVLREILENGRFHSKNIYKSVENCSFMISGRYPENGSNSISNRLARHFQLIPMTESQDKRLKSVFGKVVHDKFFSKNYTETIKNSWDCVVAATVDIYFKLKSKLKTIPSRFFVDFSPRDISNVLFGIFEVSVYSINTVEELAELWIHEILRVFGDKLFSQPDIDFLNKAVIDIASFQFKKAVQLSNIYFSHILSLNYDYKEKTYEKVSDFGTLTKIFEKSLKAYNNLHSKMKIIFFEEAIEWTLKISRVLSFEQNSHCLVLGIPGSGKRSICKFSAFVSGHEVIRAESQRIGKDEIAKGEFYKELILAGARSEPSTLILSENALKNISLMEDISSLMSNHEIVSLFSKKEEMETLNFSMKRSGKTIISSSEMIEAWKRSISRNLHIVTCSSASNQFRNFLRKFPAILKFSQVIYIGDWPETAMEKVAFSLIEDLPINEKMKKSVSKIFVSIGQSVISESKSYFTSTGIKSYATAKHFSSSILSFKSLMSTQQSQNSTRTEKLTQGVDLLASAKKEVDELKVRLSILSSRLADESKKLEKVLKQLRHDRMKTDEKEAQMAIETETVNRQTKEVKVLANEAQIELDKAMPALIEAEEALSHLNKNDIAEIRSFINPPAAVSLVMEAVAVLLGEKSEWSAIKSFIMEMDFLNRLRNFDYNNIPESSLKRLKVYVNRPEFDPIIVGQKAFACRSICMWCRAIDNYSKVYKEIAPKRERVEEMTSVLSKKTAELREKQTELEVVRKEMEILVRELDETNAKKALTTEEMNLTNRRFENAKKLTHLLEDEGVRWKSTISELSSEHENVIGNSILSSSYITYLGQFPSDIRFSLYDSWKKEVETYCIPCSALRKPFNEILGDNIEIREWVFMGLPSDTVTIDNAVISYNCNCSPYFIDPQSIGISWLEQLNKKSNNDNSFASIVRRGFETVKLNDGSLYSKILVAAEFGRVIFVEDCDENLDGICLDFARFYNLKSSVSYEYQDKKIKISKDFKLIFSTKSRFYNLSPEIFNSTTVINFSATESGLNEQLLRVVVASENPELEIQRDKIEFAIADGRKVIKECQDKILESLLNSQGKNILDDESLISFLEESKRRSTEVTKALDEIIKVEKDIIAKRNEYSPISLHATQIYFLIESLNKISVMYSFSLEEFRQLFKRTLLRRKSFIGVAMDHEKRFQEIKKTTIRLFSEEISIGLFESHATIFKLLLIFKSEVFSDSISSDTYELLVRNRVEVSKSKTENPFPELITDHNWSSLEKINAEICPSMASNKSFWSDVLARKERISNVELPPRFPEITNLEKVVFTKFTNPTFLYEEVCGCVKQEIESSQSIYSDNLTKAIYNSKKPILVVLEPGADPTSSIIKLASEMKSNLSLISMGQGQNEKAVGELMKMKKNGGWVYIQNCHYSQSFFAVILNFLENNNWEDFPFSSKLIISSKEIDNFPVPLLYKCTKVAVSKSKGIKTSMKRIFEGISKEEFESESIYYRRIFFALALFHSVVGERRKFGPLGFNLTYDFNDSDFDISCMTVKAILEKSLDESEHIKSGSRILNVDSESKFALKSPVSIKSNTISGENSSISWNSMKFLIAKINYGGKISDTFDAKLISKLFQFYLNPEVLNDEKEYEFSPGYAISSNSSLDSFRVCIEEFPEGDTPMIFGLTENSENSCKSNDSNKFIESISKLNFSLIHRKNGYNEEAISLVDSYLKELPETLRKDFLCAEYLADLQSENPSPLTTFLLSEIEKYNNLLNMISQELTQLLESLKGNILFSAEMEELLFEIIENNFPKKWAMHSYPSMRTLSSWFDDFKKRIDSIKEWAHHPEKLTYWISGMYFPRGFFTSIIQTYSRRYKIPMSSLTFKCKVIENPKSIQPSRDGVYIHGLFLEGANYSSSLDSLIEQLPGENTREMPLLFVLPTEKKFRSSEVYECPFYRTSERAGVLSSTGLSTNYVTAFDLNCKKLPPSHWRLRGVALVSETFFK